MTTQEDEPLGVEALGRNHVIQANYTIADDGPNLTRADFSCQGGINAPLTKEKPSDTSAASYVSD